RMFPPSSVDIIDESDATRRYPQRSPKNMLEPDQWDAVLSRVTGTLYRGTERVSTAHCLDLLEVGPDRRRCSRVADAARAGDRAGNADRCVDGVWRERPRSTGLGRCVPGGTPEARLGGAPQHPDRHSLGDSRCRVDTAIREGANLLEAKISDIILPVL